jgi:hypothetical protein
MDDHAWAADKAARAWFDYLRWVVAEAQGAGALITHEVVTAIECASQGRLLPAGRAAWLVGRLAGLVAFTGGIDSRS